MSRAVTFVVPAFIISAAIKQFRRYKNEDLDYIAFIKGRLKRIYLPFLLWVAAYYLYFVFRLRYFPFDFGELLSYLVLGNIAAPFYFVILIMQFYIILPISLFALKRVKPICAVLVTAAVGLAVQYLLKNFKYADRIFICYLVYWCVGGFIGLNYDSFVKYVSRRRIPLVISGAAVTFLYCLMAYATFLGIYSSFLTEAVKLVFGIIASFSLLSLMPRKHFAVLDRFSEVTYHVYLVHSLFIFEINHIMTVLGINSISLRLLIRAVFTYILSFSVCIAWRSFKNRVKC